MLAVIDQVLDALAQVNAIGTRLLLESLCACHGGACTHVHVWGCWCAAWQSDGIREAQGLKLGEGEGEGEGRQTDRQTRNGSGRWQMYQGGESGAVRVLACLPARPHTDSPNR